MKLQVVLIGIVYASIVTGQSSIKTPPPVTGAPATDAGTSPPPAPVTTPRPSGDPTCQDTLDSCNRYTVDNCIGSYEGWAKANCARWCGYCMHPNDTLPKVCEDKKSNCNEYPSEMCTKPSFRIFAEENCQKTCDKCDFRPRYLIALEKAPATTPAPVRNVTKPASGCQDLVDYCWTEPDRNCFFYEGWSRTNCPYRCGFCPETPPCENEILYCAQFNQDICTSPKYVGWARQNCRQYCNLCDLPKRPADLVTAAPGSAPNTPPARPTGTAEAPKLAGNNTGEVSLGKKSTYIIQGAPSSVPNTCFYKGEVRTTDKSWYDGCDFVCSCFDPLRNRVICTERCTQWNPLPAELTGCSLVSEPGDCCKKIECNA